MLKRIFMVTLISGLVAISSFAKSIEYQDWTRRTTDTQAKESRLYYNDTANQFKFYNGTAWQYIFSGTSASSAFLGLSDTPSSFSSQGSKLLRVNAGESAVQFATPSSVITAGDNLSWSGTTLNASIGVLNLDGGSASGGFASVTNSPVDGGTATGSFSSATLDGGDATTF